MILRAAIAATALLAPVAGQTLTLEFPAVANKLAEKIVPQDSYFLPLAPFDDDDIDGVTAEGALVQQAWKVGAGGLTTLQMLAPLRRQLDEAGYEILFECDGRNCGGFDFRYRLDVLPEPDMHVNLGDFRYLTARHQPGDRADYISLIVSRSANAGFVQVTQIGAIDGNTAVTASTNAPGADTVLPPSGPVGQQLEAQGHATLDDLTFKTGSSELGDESFGSLDELAEYLKARPEARIMLVGHTDAVGSLDGNIALSRRRAASVADRLIEKYDVARSQIGADGVGYLSPRASNQSDEGRARNRRVEVILTSTK